MAKRPEYTRFSVYSKYDPATKEYDIPSYNKDIRNIINNAVKSALPEGAFFKVGEKELAKTGRSRWDIYVHTDDKGVLGKSLSTIESELVHRKSGSEKYHITRAINVDKNTSKALWKDERGTETEESRANRWLFLKTVALLTTIANITRRILSSVLDRATVVSQDMLKAHNLGMSYDAVRGYRYAEITHGLKEGTVTGAVADIQSKFGNITSLDEKALEALAVVMGGKIEEMATLGLGSSAPEKILASILDTFNERANSGYNSVGQYVGEQQARRELYSYLLKVSPQIADIFATMQEEQHNINSLYRNQADTFESWKNAGLPARNGNNTWASYGEVKIMSEQWQKVTSLIDQIKEGITIALAPEISRLLQKIANSRLFMSESEKRNFNTQNKERNQAELDAINRTLSAVDYDKLDTAGKAYYDVLVEQKKALEKENKNEEIDDITTLPAEIQRRAEKKIREKRTTISQGDIVSPLLDITYDEISDYVRTYNLDTPENQEAYKEFREREAKKVSKEVEVENEKEHKRVKEEFNDLSSQTSKEFWKTKDKQIKKGRKEFKGNLKDLQALQTLYQVGEIFPEFEYDLLNGEGSNMYERLYKALSRAVSAGYVTQDSLSGGYTLRSEKYLEGHYFPMATGGQVSVDYNSNDYLKWLYEHNMAKINASVEAYRAEQIIKEMQTGNALQAIDWLNDSVQAMEKLAELNKKYPSATFEYRGENTRANGGENIYRVVVDVKENGKTITSQPVLDTEGGLGFQGVFGYSKAGGNIMVTGKPASY